MFSIGWKCIKPHFGSSGLGEAAKTAWVGIKLGRSARRTTKYLYFFLVEYTWKMFSPRHFRIEIDTSLSVLVVSPTPLEWTCHSAQNPSGLGEAIKTSTSSMV
jgi:hypothetical protein